MMSAPDFTVTIAKQGCDKKLALRCSFTPQNDPQDLNEQQGVYLRLSYFLIYLIRIVCCKPCVTHQFAHLGNQ